MADHLPNSQPVEVVPGEAAPADRIKNSKTVPNGFNISQIATLNGEKPDAMFFAEQSTAKSLRLMSRDDPAAKETPNSFRQTPSTAARKVASGLWSAGAHHENAIFLDGLIFIGILTAMLAVR